MFNNNVTPPLITRLSVINVLYGLKSARDTQVEIPVWYKLPDENTCYIWWLITESSVNALVLTDYLKRYTMGKEYIDS